MDTSVGMVSLGCAKNQVDAEMLMASLERGGFKIQDDAALADVVIVNTCGFIESAKREAVEEILELARLKQEGRIKKIVVTGCMAQRYHWEIHEQLPEVDAVVGIGANGEIERIIREMLHTQKYTQSVPAKENMPICGERRISTPGYFAYIKIAEGCDNVCTYCAIPAIRGRFRSRAIEDIEKEAIELSKNGAKEIVLVAQDTTRYGMDIYGEYSLARLLRRLCKIDGLRWIRILYCYPEGVTDELLEVIAEEEKVVKYMDLPLQHASGRILKAMNRAGDSQTLMSLINKIRERVPQITLRSTFIAGFPGETDQDFAQLAQFVKDVRFDRMGCFVYSPEEGTYAAEMDDQVEQQTKERRAEIIMQMQMDIMQEKGEDLIGSEREIMVEGYDRYAQCWFGRSQGDAPDIDGKVFFTAGRSRPMPGDFIKVCVTDCIDCDLFGQAVEIS